MKITETSGGVIIEVFVKPRSPKFELKINDEEIIVYCTGEPTKGKVNREIVKEFSKLFGHRVEMVSGSTSRQKKFLISDIGRNEVEHIFVKKR